MGSPDGARIGVDVGGTFTDVVVLDQGRTRIAKVASTPDDQAEGVLDGVAAADVDPATIGRFSHGTTVATNTVLERDGARTVVVLTDGFRDLLEIGRQDRPSLYDLWADRPEPLARADRVVEVAERVDAGGAVIRALTDDEVARVVAAVREREPEAIAVSLLFAFLDDDHERRVAAALEDALAGVEVSRSSDVLPVFREYERTSTTALNAYVAPRMRRYLTSLDDRLRDAGVDCGVEVMRSGGGTSTAGLAGRYPVHTLLSGPAAGAWGAAAAGRASGVGDLLAFDMGGTSTDVTLIEDGRPRTTADGSIGGLPFGVLTTDIHTIGSGGGSIGWRDPGGSLRVGPRSAGARPGPASYGRGGREPTVTDAHVVLGALPSSVQLGGRLVLDRDAAVAAVSGLADDLGLSPDETAAGIVRVVEAQMVKALRVVSVEQGRDPRRLTLVPFGGAGPLHQAALARELGCRRVLVPPRAGVLSALGLLAAPVTADAVRTHLVATRDATGSALDDAWRALEDEVRGRFDDQGATLAHLRRSADLRYRGQAFELEVAAPRPDLDRLAADFHDAHEQRYGYRQDDEVVEIVNLRVRGESDPPDAPLPGIAAGTGADDAVVGATTVRTGDGAVEHPVYERSRLGAGDTFDGPAVVVGVDATCRVAAWQRVEVDAVGALVLTDREAGPDTDRGSGPDTDRGPRPDTDRGPRPDTDRGSGPDTDRGPRPDGPGDGDPAGGGGRWS